ncbi:MAG: Gfo/Idh/MocA family oxidoreductase [Chloroflexota bacterium]|nr:Gfo/Idh/MocA family oxidoreductase [Chloroflexota bacterium]
MTPDAAPRPLVEHPEQPIRIVLYGTQHSHARGKAGAMAARPDVELVGVCEPDAASRARAREHPAYAGLRWFDTPAEFLEDRSVVGVCVEGEEGKCVELARQCVAAGKHIWYDKPAGDYAIFEWMVDTARERRLHIQMGYMLRYSGAFRQISDWARDGLLGDIFAVRGHMSTSSSAADRGRQGYVGGIAFQLAPHMMDQAIWLLGGRPEKVTSFLRNDATPDVPAHADNTLVVLEFSRGMAMIDIANMEPGPAARRFEVYGTQGSAIVLEPFEPGGTVRLCLTDDAQGYQKGARMVTVEPTPREQSYHHELAAFVATLQGKQAPDRTLDHELLVEETLHRAVGTLSP